MAKPSIVREINRRASEQNIPLSVLIELTYRCNHACYYCYQKTLDKRHELSRTHWSRILGQLSRAGTLYITFSGGELLLRPDAISIIEDARSRGFAVSIITNGTLLTPSIAKQLKDAGIMDAGISFLASGARLHDRLSGVKGSFARALAGLRLCAAAGIKTTIKHTVSSENFGEFARLQKLADREGSLFECDANVVTHLPGTRSPFALSVDQYVRFLRAMKVKPLRGRPESYDRYTLHCDAGRSVAGITPGGDVVPCIQLPLVFGNLKQRSFEQIWKGSAAKDFRQKEKKLDKSCLYCDISHLCSRCAGIVFYETGKTWQGSASILCDRAAAMAKIAK